MSQHAEALGLNVAAFSRCLSENRHAGAVREDMAEAIKAGVTGTPSGLLALTDPEDPTKVMGLTFIRGAQPYDSFETRIDQALAEAK